MVAGIRENVGVLVMVVYSEDVVKCHWVVSKRHQVVLVMGVYPQVGNGYLVAVCLNVAKKQHLVLGANYQNLYLVDLR